MQCGRHQHELCRSGCIRSVIRLTFSHSIEIFCRLFFYHLRFHPQTLKCCFADVMMRDDFAIGNAGRFIPDTVAVFVYSFRIR
jgi:hypothetical protein